MANEDSTAYNEATPEQLAEQYPDNCDPFEIWYCIDAPHNKWAVNDENGDAFIEVINHKTAAIISEALKIRHKIIDNHELSIDAEQQKAINHALLIGLDSYGEIERISNEIGVKDLCPGGNRIPDSIRPIHPTGSADTISIFATALRYIQQA
ncbi:hypothetical protein SAMN06296273_0291 [Nitrosomonas ureae]|uniref:Uncharacterized protein n=1 Tax=Nitrosomonas ureae TaxID=44577 RepID=A0A285BUQ6_9PROT|nr:hypothetical protein [Nitrosomonas ureae]SNX58825.1 hypothetical protein SAMN06296273_0291 [Nitrosomonas ureae]